MIIPVRCFTCGTILASKYKRYLKLMNSNLIIKDDVLYAEGDIDPEGGVLITIEDRKEHILSKC